MHTIHASTLPFKCWKHSSKRCGRPCLQNNNKVKRCLTGSQVVTARCGKSYGYDWIGIKNFIVSVIIKTSSDEAALEKEKTYLGKLNIVLVQVGWKKPRSWSSRKVVIGAETHSSQILKHEWPHNWPTFIPEIINSSKTNLALCENNMAILKLLR